MQVELKPMKVFHGEIKYPAWHQQARLVVLPALDVCITTIYTHMEGRWVVTEESYTNVEGGRHYYRHLCQSGWVF